MGGYIQEDAKDGEKIKWDVRNVVTGFSEIYGIVDLLRQSNIYLYETREQKRKEKKTERNQASKQGPSPVQTVRI